MNRRASGHDLADRQRAVRLLAADLVQHLAGHRHVRGAADQQQAIHLLPAEARLAQHFLGRELGAGQQVAGQTFKFSAAQGYGQHLAAVVAGHAGLRQFAEGALGSLRGRAQGCQRLRILARVEAVLLDKFASHVIDNAVIPVLTAQAHVPHDRQGLEMTLSKPHQRHVECPAAQVIHEYGALLVR